MFRNINTLYNYQQAIKSDFSWRCPVIEKENINQIHIQMRDWTYKKKSPREDSQILNRVAQDGVSLEILESELDRGSGHFKSSLRFFQKPNPR